MNAYSRRLAKLPAADRDQIAAAEQDLSVASKAYLAARNPETAAAWVAAESRLVGLRRVLVWGEAA